MRRREHSLLLKVSKDTRESGRKRQPHTQPSDAGVTVISAPEAGRRDPPERSNLGLAKCAPHNHALLERVEECLRRYQIGAGEALAEPPIDRCEKLVRRFAPALVAPQPGEADAGAQFPSMGTLTARPVEGLPEVTLGRSRCMQSAFMQNKVTFYAQQLSYAPNVRVLSYDNSDGTYSGLWNSLRAWADRSDDPGAWRGSIVTIRQMLDTLVDAEPTFRQDER